jgi:hypothetical protein
MEVDGFGALELDVALVEFLPVVEFVPLVALLAGEGATAAA